MEPITVTFQATEENRSGIATLGSHRLVADRPYGVAQGTGAGLNGAQLFASALGGCFWNDLHYAAADLGVDINVQEVSVDIRLSTAPLRIASAGITARLNGPGADAAFAHAQENSTVANSILPAIPVAFERKAP